MVRYQPNRDYVSNDDIQTPAALAAALVKEISPSGAILEPCAGEGAFLQALPAGTLWCEIKKGRDFFDWSRRVDWVITNPPWSKIRGFLRKSFEVSDNVAFLMTINHAWTRARLRDAKEAGFGLIRILILETPRSFPQSGFQLGMVVYKRGSAGPIRLEEVEGQW
jgi:hypothetical protein